MPIIQVNMLEGRSPAQKQAMMKRVTEAVVETLGVRSESVRIFIHDISSGDFAVGGEPRFTEGAAKTAEKTETAPAAPAYPVSAA